MRPDLSMASEPQPAISGTAASGVCDSKVAGGRRTLDDFRGAPFQRLRRIEALSNAGAIDADLRWTSS